MISLDDQQTAGDGQDSTGTTQFGETQQMRFQIRYYRDARWAERYERAGVDKPEGYVTSTAMPLPEAHVREVAAHINSFKPTQPCLVARVR